MADISFIWTPVVQLRLLDLKQLIGNQAFSPFPSVMHLIQLGNKTLWCIRWAPSCRFCFILSWRCSPSTAELSVSIDIRFSLDKQKALSSPGRRLGASCLWPQQKVKGYSCVTWCSLCRKTEIKIFFVSGLVVGIFVHCPNTRVIQAR